MRLTCPNCGAQYEVPDQVIPLDGRDVQCSNCGGTWFQDHPDNPQPAQAHVPPEAEDDLWDDQGEPDDDEYDYDPEPDYDDASDPEEDAHRAPPSRDVSVNDLLREEAEREARLRAAEQLIASGDLVRRVERRAGALRAF